MFRSCSDRKPDVFKTSKVFDRSGRWARQSFPERSRSQVAGKTRGNARNQYLEQRFHCHVPQPGMTFPIVSHMYAFWRDKKYEAKPRWLDRCPASSLVRLNEILILSHTRFRLSMADVLYRAIASPDCGPPEWNVSWGISKLLRSGSLPRCGSRFGRISMEYCF